MHLERGEITMTLVLFIVLTTLPVVIYLSVKKPVSLPGAIWFTLQFYALAALLAGGGFAVLAVVSQFPIGRNLFH
jgi:hypothetical protein